jgi:hypothetical protein
MASLTSRKPHVKPARFARLLWLDSSKCWFLRLFIGTAETGYYLFPLAADFGKAFRLEKIGADGGETYHVNIDAERSTCECPGFLRWKHCKHLQRLLALQQAGRLDS